MTALLACGGCVNGSSPSLAQAPLRFSYSEAGDLEISRPDEAVAGVVLAASVPGDSPVGLMDVGAMPGPGLTGAVLGAPMAVRVDTPVALSSIDAAASGINAVVSAAQVPATAPVVAALPDLGISANVAGVTVNAGLANGNVAAGLGVDPAVAPTLPPVVAEAPVVTPVLTALLPPQTPTLAPTALIADVVNLPGAVAGLNSLLGRR